ncbi:MAG TPA: hypothetical protein VMS08_00160 [Candidatus Saccharimonadia bacterium]|nr:hypothetical protein [Candidatus Saccharimonadia bacterium]
MTTEDKVLALYREPYDFNAMYMWAKEFMAGDITAADINGFVGAINELATPLRPDADLTRAIDVSGTGGDGLKTINVGTVASFVMAAAGLTVGKQSAPGYTGVMGSLGFLSELGIAVKLADGDAREFEQRIEKSHLAFYSHTAFNQNFVNQRRFMTELKEQGTVFITPVHLLFWIYNPLPLKYRVYGMFTDKYLPEVAEAFRRQGIKRGWVVNGAGGMDEVSVLGPTKVVEFDSNGLSEFEVEPADFGVTTVGLGAITVSDAQDAVLKATLVLRGEDQGALRDLVAINAGAGLYLAGQAPTLREATEIAIKTLESKAAWRKYEEYRVSLS